MLPVLRGLSAEGAPKLLHLNTSAEVMEFVNSNDLEPLAALGTSCPDHFLRTKIRPMIVPESVYALEGAELSAQKTLVADTAPTTPPITSAANAPTARHFAIRTPW